MRLRRRDDKQRTLDLRRVVSQLKRITVTITDDAYDRARAEAADSQMTVAQWIAWLAETYEPPQEVDRDGE